MKTIVSLALAGLMSISALLPALGSGKRWRRISIAESSGISESMAQDENTAFGSGSLANGSAVSIPAVQRMKAPSRSPAAMQGLMFRSPNPTVCRWSLTAAFRMVQAETSSSLPVSESTVSDETESASGSETAESDIMPGIYLM